MKAWMANFDKLKRVRDNGINIAKLPRKHFMRSWVDTQRRKYWAAIYKGIVMGKRSKPMYARLIRGQIRPLTQDQVNALEALGMEWDPLRANFDARFAALKQYKEQNKGSLKGLNHQDRRLYQWAVDQKARYLKKKYDSGLPEQDANLLRGLGFNIPKQISDGDHDSS